MMTTKSNEPLCIISANDIPQVVRLAESAVFRQTTGSRLPTSHGLQLLPEEENGKNRVSLIPAYNCFFYSNMLNIRLFYV